MLLYLVRHAHAVTEEEDPSRPLSLRGADYTRRLAEFFKSNGAFTPAQVWHSPLRRARETAEILTRGLELEAGLVETPGLTPDDDPDDTVKRLASLMSTKALAIVGHEPHLSTLATLLVRGKARPELLEFKKGAVLALERTDEIHRKSGDPRWIILWHVSPALLPPAFAVGSAGSSSTPSA